MFVVAETTQRRSSLTMLLEGKRIQRFKFLRLVRVAMMTMAMALLPDKL